MPTRRNPDGSTERISSEEAALDGTQYLDALNRAGCFYDDTPQERHEKIKTHNATTRENLGCSCRDCR